MSELPKGWLNKSLLELCDVKTGKVDANHASVDGKYTFFTCALEPMRADSYSFEGELIVLPGNGANVGHVDFYKGKIEAYQRTYILHNIHIDSLFLYYHLKAYWKKRNEEKQFGSATNYIKMGNFKDYIVSFPPLAEQTRIVEKLDEVLAQVDTIKARLDGIPAILKRFRQSVLASAVSGKLIDVKAPNLKTIGNVSEDIRYGTSKKCDYKGGSTPVIRIPNIGDRKLDTSDLKSADFTEKELEKLALKAGDLLVIRSNGSLELVAKPALVEPQYEGFLYAGYLIRIRCDREKIIPSFLLNVLSSRVVRDVVEMGARSTSGVNNINSKELSALEFVLPSLEEQKEIVRLVDQYFAFADNIDAQVKKAQARVDNLTQSILAKAFRGELVPQDPNDESADKLLERIAQARKEAEALAKATKKAEAAKKKVAKSV
ncbi:restriction endonuclease subunit S [Vibrio harveyi]